MSQTYGTPAGGGLTGSDDQRSPGQTDHTREVAADEARGVASDAKAAGEQTLGTAKEQAADVTHEVKSQASAVFSQAKQELASQAGDQHQRAASGLRALADELDSMVQGSDQNGVANDLARQASDRTREVASWLEVRQPGDVLDEVKSFARRRPGAFLVGAAVVGLVGGRLTRGIADQARHDGDESAPSDVTAAPYTSGQTPVGMSTMPPPPVVPDPTSSFSPGASSSPVGDPLTDPLTDPLDGQGTYGEGRP